MAAATYNISVEQGDTWTLSLVYRAPNNDDGSPGDPFDLTGCVAAMQIRTAVGATPPLVSLTETSGITLGTTDGSISIIITEAQTNLITTTRAKYDLHLTFPDGTTRRLLEGKVTITPSITEPTTA